MYNLRINIFKKFQRQLVYGVALVLTWLILPTMVYAQTFADFTLFPGINTLGDLINLVIQVITAIASPIAVFMIMLGGFQTMFGGDKDIIKKGINKIIAATAGLGIILMANSIENMIQGVFFGGEIDIVFLVKLIQVLLIRNLTIIAVAVATLAMIWGGYKDMLSSFNAESKGAESAKNAIVGLSVVFLAGGIAQIVTGAIDPEESNIIRSLENLIGNISGTLESVISMMTVLAVIVSMLVIIKGGYDYFLSSVSDKVKPIETIQKGVIGLAVSLAGGFLALLMFDLFGRVDNVSVVFNFSRLPSQAERVLKPLLNNGISFAVSMASIVAVCVIVYGGYIYFASAVSEQKKKGMEVLTKGVIGLIVIILAGPIVRFIPTIIRASYGTNDTLVEFKLSPEPIINIIREILANFVIPIVGLVTVFFFVYGGYLWLTARGSTEQVKKARTALTNALIGLLITLLATTAVGLIVYFLKPDEYIKPQTEIQVPAIQPQSDQSLPLP
jgi:TRAP-type C4-dicarboxylate transport system permease small subunit